MREIIEIEIDQWEYRVTGVPYIDDTCEMSYVVAEASCNDGEEYLLKWEINGKNVDDLYDFCSYWPVTKVSPKTPEKLEYEIVSFKTLHDFIEELSKEFRLSCLGAVLPLLNYSAYHYNVELSIEDEGSYDKVSKIDFYINYNMSWGANEPTTRQGELELFWTTGSNHTVSITGEWGDDWSTFKVVLGDEVSRGFYPAVREILGRYASDSNDTRIA